MSDNFVKDMEAAIDRFFAEKSPQEIAKEISAAEEGSGDFNLLMSQPHPQTVVSFQGSFHVQTKICAVHARQMRTPKRYQLENSFALSEEIDVDSVGFFNEPVALAA